LPDALSVLDADSAAGAITRLEDRLRGRFGLPAVISLRVDPLLVTTSKDIRLAERRLLRSVVKATDGFMARHVERPISLQISRCLAPTAIRPTQVTMISMIIGLCGAPLFSSPHWYWQTAGALLFLLHSIVDGCDGELARLKFQESRYGGVLDFWADNIVHVAVFGSMAAGWASSAGAAWPLLLGAAAMLGTLGSAGFVYWRQMRGRDGSGPLFTSVSGIADDPLARLLDAASRRDFIYLVVALALIGKSSWFLLLAAVGAPTYCLLLIYLAAREPVRSE
jgi:phosphatidylglycerophosphate synthase